MTASIGPRLRHRVAFAQLAVDRDSNGFTIEAWTPVSGMQDVPAEVLAGPGKESTPAGAPVSTTAARITLRYQSELEAPYGLRVQFGAAFYHVETFYTDPTGRRWVTLVCSTGAKHG